MASSLLAVFMAWSRLLHRGDNVGIGGAAAEISAHVLADVGVAVGMAFVDAGDRRHDLPGRAVAALEGVVIDEGLLHRMQLAVLRETFDRRDHFAIPATATASVRHDNTRRPSSRTVQAPHWPWSQPFFAPVRPTCSRSASSNVVRDVERKPVILAIDLERELKRITRAPVWLGPRRGVGGQRAPNQRGSRGRNACHQELSPVGPGIGALGLTNLGGHDHPAASRRPLAQRIWFNSQGWRQFRALVPILELRGPRPCRSEPYGGVCFFILPFQ